MHRFFDAVGPGRVLFIAEDNDSSWTVGMGGILLGVEGDDSAERVRMSVLESCRGQGVGSAM